MVVNLRELSGMLGLSQTTVSRAINGYPEVAEETRARVMQAARQTGYRPSPAARHLARGVPRLLGVVVPADDLDYQALTALQTILVEQVARKDFRIVLLPALRDDESDNALRDEFDFDIAGIIWLRPSRKIQKTLRDQHPQLPAVFLDLEGPGDKMSNWVTIDHTAAARSAATFLFQLGHRELHVILGHSAATREELLVAGARLAAEAFFGSGKEEVSFSLLPPNDSCEALLRQFDAHGWPSAILASDMAAFRLLSEAAFARGLAIGKEVSIIGQDVAGPQQSRFDTAPATALRLSKDQIVAAVVETIAARIVERDAAPVQVRLKPELVLGKSTGPAADRA